MLTSENAFSIYLEEWERRDLRKQLTLLVAAAQIDIKTMVTTYLAVSDLQQALLDREE